MGASRDAPACPPIVADRRQVPRDRDVRLPLGQDEPHESGASQRWSSDLDIHVPHQKPRMGCVRLHSGPESLRRLHLEDSAAPEGPNH